MVHVDKLKMCRGETPKSWLAIDEDDDDKLMQPRMRRWSRRSQTTI